MYNASLASPEKSADYTENGNWEYEVHDATCNTAQTAFAVIAVAYDLDEIFPPRTVRISAATSSAVGPSKSAKSNLDALCSGLDTAQQIKAKRPPAWHWACPPMKASSAKNALPSWHTEFSV